jgi:chromosome segregation ATPase
MNSVGISDPGRGSRIDQAVAREMKRSKTLLWFYSLLLVIPIGACAVYYLYGRTDVALVRGEVNSNIGPLKQIVEQSAPALAQVRQTAERLSAQESRLDSVSQKQEALATAVQTVPEKLQEVELVRTDLSAVKADVDSVRVQSQKLGGSVDSALTGVAQLNDRISSISQQQTRIEGSLKDLSVRFEKIRPLSPTDGSDQLRRQQELINSLQERIKKLEQVKRVDPRTERPQ